MARRSSNKDRIDRMRAEADATERESEKKRKAKPASTGSTTPRSRAAAKAEPGRMKIVWAVKSPAGKILKTFPYPLKAAAEAEADRLTEETCKDHLVRPEKVPMD